MNRACFPREKTPEFTKWVKFMNYSFWPFLLFGLPGRLLSHIAKLFRVLFFCGIASLSREIPEAVNALNNEVRGWKVCFSLAIPSSSRNYLRDRTDVPV